MKAIHHFLITALFILGAFTLVLQTSCKDKCGSTTCQNGGICGDNVCECPEGYSGDACQTGWSDASIGTYTCSRANCVPSVSGAASWQSSITKDATNGGFIIDISNFDNSGVTVLASIDSSVGGMNNITISPAVGSYGVEATGTFSNNVINLQFTSAGAGGVSGYRCNMVMKKE